MSSDTPHSSCESFISHAHTIYVEHVFEVFAVPAVHSHKDDSHTCTYLKLYQITNR